MVIKIVFLLLDDVHLLDLAGADQVFHEAIESGAELRVTYCSAARSVTTSGRLGLSKLKSYASVRIGRGDYLFIPGAKVDSILRRSVQDDRKLFEWVRSCHDRGVTICSVCTGAFFLAKTGLLNGRKCTTHWKRAAELQKRFPFIQVVENILFTEDNGILTSAGVTAGVDLALHILARLKGDHFSFSVARELVVYIRRQGNESQQSLYMLYRNHIHSGIHRAQDYIEANIHDRLSLFAISDVACMSTRSLTRTFRKETGISVNDYITMLRKERINELSKNPDITRRQMAELCGLKSERQVGRLIAGLK